MFGIYSGTPGEKNVIDLKLWKLHELIYYNNCTVQTIGYIQVIGHRQKLFWEHFRVHPSFALSEHLANCTQAPHQQGWPV